jgi:hypothetical protein
MGKYKQWLHHQEIGRRLRDQINTLEQERARVQKMAPSHPTALPELENPLIAALLAYTKQGNKLSNIDVIKAAMPKLGPDPDQRRPAGSAVTAASTTPSATTKVGAPAGDPAVVASLLARADQMPADPFEQMQALSRAGDRPTTTEPTARAMPTASEPPRADSVGGWWQRHRDDDGE